MSAWPVFEGLSPRVERTRVQPTLVQTSSTGKRTTVQTQSQGIYRYSLTYNFVRSSTGELTTLISTLDAAKGRAVVFTFTDPIDSQSRNVALASDEVTIAQIVPGVVELTIDLEQVL